MKVGCNVRGTMINLLCFADDMVLLAHSWSALQSLIDVLFTSADRINMKFNANKPTVSRKIVAHNFPQFTAGNDKLKFVDRFKYLGNIITKDLCDDEDIEREIKCLFTRCNVLISRFKHCSWLVKLKLSRSYCLCFYSIALWCSYNKTSLCRFVSIATTNVSSVSLVMPSIAVCLMSSYKLVCQLGVTLSCLTVSSDFVKSYFLPVIS